LRGPLSADLKATDGTRLLRVVGTVNSRTGTIARLVWSNDVGGVPLRYGFDALADEVLPILRPSHHERRGEVRVGTEGARGEARGASHYTVGSLWWGRYRDIRRLCALRGWSAPYGGVPEGYRDQVLFLGSVALSWLALPVTWWGEVESLAAELTPSLREREWKTYVGTAYRRLLASVGDEKRESRYRYSTARIISDLGISREEMASLEVLLDPDLTHARKLKKDQERIQELRRASGVVERGTYLATAEERAQEARRLSSEGLSIREVADRLGISKSQVQRIVGQAQVSHVRRGV
jgi:AraC-like DNA-binding protein